ncbi:MAG: hypothetical protein B7Y05_05275 [Polynucleobacter sp. 24-46-87]|nr:MAG: hypothetical protein B7Y55_00435 [Polynucleobacter sp. 35-46-207]OYZ39061.1 MAG: hypothetical protein B7Y22_00075 [Polynucleobacter sp. 16-46-70]OZA15106.1 MAG: hypothetical protein B7Y05_05275 [Polynucleobacter sp. 24-46-87]OZA42137.1 MAG: hypothetical protein B7X83_00365 [Polynucleobacter sp. 17-46-58]OZB49668.1 MAG: hypothetical protein B7X60_00370 [Polynucleobacter sp. 39-45-136]
MSNQTQNIIITCPHCQGRDALEIPRGESMHLYRCPSCNSLLKAKSGDCCILCSFGDQDCTNSEQNLAA